MFRSTYPEQMLPGSTMALISETEAGAIRKTRKNRAGHTSFFPASSGHQQRVARIHLSILFKVEELLGAPGRSWRQLGSSLGPCGG